MYTPDFIEISVWQKGQSFTVEADFVTRDTNDLMIRGGQFYAFWDVELNSWSMDFEKCQRIIDALIMEKWEEVSAANVGCAVSFKCLRNSKSGEMTKFLKYLKERGNNFQPLDTEIHFLGEQVTRNQYATKRLPYNPQPGITDNYEHLFGTLYNPEELQKLEWMIGAILLNESYAIQKFITLYGAAGTGKSTFLRLLRMIFEGYWVTFDAKSIVSGNSAFALTAFKDSPLVAIQDDADLSRVEDSTHFNSLVSKERIVINRKHIEEYEIQAIATLFVGTNEIVAINNAMSGMNRRLLDVSPSELKLPREDFERSFEGCKYEIPAIAWRCMEVYRKLGRSAYDDYKPVKHKLNSDPIYSFVVDHFDMFTEHDGITLKTLYTMFKDWATDCGLQRIANRSTFETSIKTYFYGYADKKTINGARLTKYYYDFKGLEIYGSSKAVINADGEKEYELELNESVSLLDDLYADQPAQRAVPLETGGSRPEKSWDNCVTKLRDISSRTEHFVLVPEQHIVIDFDLTDDEGEKDRRKNLVAAGKFPPTYAEFSKSGSGVHLHYIWDGDTSLLASEVSPGIEIKVLTGKQALRRRLGRCNKVPIAHLSSGLPLREEKKTEVVDFDGIKDEKHLRNLIGQALSKKVHKDTSSNIDWIKKLTDNAYDTPGFIYDITDLREGIWQFANQSTHQSDRCVKVVGEMKFKSQNQEILNLPFEKDQIAFFDVEVFPNFFCVCWKYQGNDRVFSIARAVDGEHKMTSLTPDFIRELVRYKLVGFNCRKYDNHILYGAMLGETNEELFVRSSGIINGSPEDLEDDPDYQGSDRGRSRWLFPQAYGLSYTDPLDYGSNEEKIGLKKWEIKLDLEMGIPVDHVELDIPWDQPIPHNLWDKVIKYCENDVIALEKVFEATSGSFAGRCALAELAGLTPNDKTNKLTAVLLFGDDKPNGPNNKNGLVYTDLSTGWRSDGTRDIIAFEGYEFRENPDTGKMENWYKGINTGKGGLVIAHPGAYISLGLFDVESMHPSSAVAENYFGVRTPLFAELLASKNLIKHKEFDKLKTMFNGKFVPFLNDKDYKNLTRAVKLALNSVYGLTSAQFDNPFWMKENRNNIVALRGALFMVDLYLYLASIGYPVVHVKTDSVKVPNVTDEVAQAIYDFARPYGYTFEYEDLFERYCLVNGSTYIAKSARTGKWEGKAAQFIQPYVFKSLFSKEPLEFKDYVIVKEGKKAGAIYLRLPDADDDTKDVFCGKVAGLVPIKPGYGGREALHKAIDKDGNPTEKSVNGTKGYLWKTYEVVRYELDNGLFGGIDQIDFSYFETLCNDAIAAIEKHCDFDWFVNGDISGYEDAIEGRGNWLQEQKNATDVPIGSDEIPPYESPCGTERTCCECPERGRCEAFQNGHMSESDVYEMIEVAVEHQFKPTTSCYGCKYYTTCGLIIEEEVNETN